MGALVREDMPNHKALSLQSHFAIHIVETTERAISSRQMMWVPQHSTHAQEKTMLTWSSLQPCFTHPVPRGKSATFKMWHLTVQVESIKHQDSNQYIYFCYPKDATKFSFKPFQEMNRKEARTERDDVTVRTFTEVEHASVCIGSPS